MALVRSRKNQPIRENDAPSPRPPVPAVVCWKFGGDESRRRRGHDVNIPWGRVAAPPRTREIVGRSRERLKRRRVVPGPRPLRGVRRAVARRGRRAARRPSGIRHDGELARWFRLCCVLQEDDARILTLQELAETVLVGRDPSILREDNASLAKHMEHAAGTTRAARRCARAATIPG